MARAERNRQTKLVVATGGLFGTPFLTPESPPQNLCGSLSRTLSQDPRNEAREDFLGAQNRGFANGVSPFFFSENKTEEKEKTEENGKKGKNRNLKKNIQKL